MLTLPHLNHVFHIHLKILWNHKFYRISLDSHQMNVKSLIQGMLSSSKDDLWAVMLFANGDCLSRTERNWDRRQDRWVELGRGGSLWRWFRENAKKSLNVTFGMIPYSVDQMLAGMHHSTSWKLPRDFLYVELQHLKKTWIILVMKEVGSSPVHEVEACVCQ